MLADVLGNFLDAVAEREFAAPLMELLRVRGFSDIHFVHGSFEFGKDLIAKHDGNGHLEQWAFQSKAGDLNLGEWNRLRGQLESLRTNAIAHPSFDSSAPRRPVLVTTGRLVGGAAADAQQWAEYLRARGEAPVEIWDRERLIEYLSPEVAMAGATPASLLAFLGRLETQVIDDRDIERFSREWLTGERTRLLAAGFQAILIANRFAASERLDLACVSALCLLRAACAKCHGLPANAPEWSTARIARRMFSDFAGRLWDRCVAETLDPREMIVSHELPTAFITYPVRCCRIVELLGLFGLLNAAIGKREEAERVTAYLEQFIAKHPGASHPISDRWAVSVVPPSLLLIRAGRSDAVMKWLTAVTRWVADRIQKGSGLSAADSTPQAEIEQLLGPALEHLQVTDRKESYLSSVLLDLAALLRKPEFYDLVINEVLAVRAVPTITTCNDDVHQYLPAGPNITVEPNPPYARNWEPTDGWTVAPHHRAEPDRRALDVIDRSWELLAISSVLRDRHFLSACRRMLPVG